MLQPFAQNPVTSNLTQPPPVQPGLVSLVFGVVLFVFTGAAGVMAQENGGVQIKHSWPAVVVTSPPLHSLVAGIMGPEAAPVLVFRRAVTHHQSGLRPSQLRQLSQADLLVWSGAQLEAPVATLLDKKIIEVPNWSAMGCKNQRLLPWRSGLVVHEMNLDVNLAANFAAKSSIGEDPDGATWDPHSWLDPNNAICYLREISQLLINIDPGHQAHYQRNTKQLISRLTQLDLRLRAGFVPARAPFLVYHNSFRYLLEGYGLQPLAELNPVHDQPPGLRELLEFRGLIKSGRATCLLADLSVPAGQFKAWQSNSRVISLRLDPTGSSLPPGPELYFDLLINLSDEIVKCLAGGAIK